MIKAVIFDFFGVICSDDYWRFVKRDRQSDSEFSEIAKEVNLGSINWQSFVEKVAKATNSTVQEVGRMYESEHIDPRVVELINSLHGQYKTALITNAHHDFIDEMLTRNHIDKLFDTIVVSSREGVIKPSPEIFERTLEKLDIKPEEAIYVDDLERHVNAARQLGMNGILYKYFPEFKHTLSAALSTE